MSRSASPRVQPSSAAVGAAVLAVGAEINVEGNTSYFKVKAISDDAAERAYVLLPVYSFDQWQAAEYVWQCPLSLATKKGAPQHGLWAQQLGPTRDLKAIIAQAGFPSASEAAIHRLVKYFELPVDIGSDLFDVLTALIQSCAPHLTERDILHILEKRAVQRGWEAAALLSSELSEAYGKDAETVQHWATAKFKTYDGLAPYKSKLWTLSKKLALLAPALPKAKKAKAKAKGAPAVTDAGLFSEDAARLLLPLMNLQSCGRTIPMADGWGCAWVAVAVVHGASMARPPPLL